MRSSCLRYNFACSRFVSQRQPTNKLLMKFELDQKDHTQLHMQMRALEEMVITVDIVHVKR